MLWLWVPAGVVAWTGLVWASVKVMISWWTNSVSLTRSTRRSMVATCLLLAPVMLLFFGLLLRLEGRPNSRAQDIVRPKKEIKR